MPGEAAELVDLRRTIGMYIQGLLEIKDRHHPSRVVLCSWD